MKMKVFTVFDSKAEIFGTPIYSATTASGIRIFEAACNEEGRDFNKWPGDYTLFEIGEWNDNTGHVEMHEVKKELGLALTYIDQALSLVKGNENHG